MLVVVFLVFIIDRLLMDLAVTKLRFDGLDISAMQRCVTRSAVCYWWC